MLDSNILDRLAAEPGLALCLGRLVRSGAIAVITTHIQMQELGTTPDENRRSKLMQVLRIITCKRIPTAAIIWGISAWGEASYASEESLRAIDEVVHKSISGKHIYDALIASTAILRTDALVTEEKRLRARIREAYPEYPVWSFDQFRHYLLTLN